jgi:hypothetical protein
VCKHSNVFSLPVLNRSIGLTIKFARCKVGQHNPSFMLGESSKSLPFDYLRALI